MNDYVIITESTADLPKRIIDEYDIKLLRMTYILNGKQYEDKPTKTGTYIRSFYDNVKKGEKPYTSQINQSRFYDVFSEYLEDGKDVLFIGFSSGLSGTFNQAKKAVNELNNEYPSRKIYLVDTKAVSLGQGLLVYEAAKMRADGKSIDEVSHWVERNVMRVCHWFTVDDLMHLKRGGKISSSTALFGSLIGVKPILTINHKGKIANYSKAIGRKRALEVLVKYAGENIVNPAEQTIFISHSDCMMEAEHLAELAKEKLKVKDVKINYIGPTIGTHVGPGAVGIFYLGTERYFD